LLFAILKQAEFKEIEEISRKLFIFFFTLILDEPCEIPWKRQNQIILNETVNNDPEKKDDNEIESCNKIIQFPGYIFLLPEVIDLIIDKLKDFCKGIHIVFAYPVSDYLLNHVSLFFLFVFL
jgi:hypothetical protein